MRIGDVPKLRGTDLRTIGPTATVHEAIKTLVRHNIGALPVCGDGGELIGIVTERDILRLAAGNDCHEAIGRRVGDVMTTDLIIGVADDDIDYALHVMTENRIRHLPILDGRRLLDIISIGDLVKARLEATRTEVRFLRDYVMQ